MRANYDLLGLVAVGAAWMFGHLAAPLWMPAIAATLVAVSHWLDLQAGARREQYASPAKRVAFEALGRCSGDVTAVLCAYGVGLVVGNLG